MMSFYGEQELSKSNMNHQQLKRMIESIIMTEMAGQKRARAYARSEFRAQGKPCDPTTSESSEDEEDKGKKNEKKKGGNRN